MSNIQIFIKAVPTNEVTPLEMDLCDTLCQVKERILEILGVPIENQTLIFAGKRLLEDGNRLVDFNIQRESTLHLIINP